MAPNKITKLKPTDSDLDNENVGAGTAKIFSLPELAAQVKYYRTQGKTIVLCHGTFDLLHIGHIRHLQRARQEGDVLFVTVTADAYVNKGPGRPVFSEMLRVENLAALACTDYIAINHAITGENIIDRIKPDVYVKGSDYIKPSDDVTGNILKETQAVERNGGRVFYTREITYSSSRLLNEHFEVFSPETRQYLKNFKSRHSAYEIHQSLKALQTMNVLVVGDAIIDEYHYTSPLGQIGKGNVLAVKYRYEEKFAGGAVAVANHVAGFTGKVTLMTGLGLRDSYEEFIKSKLLKNVYPVFLKNPESRTLIKRRYIGDEMTKLFEVYISDVEHMPKSLDLEACHWLNDNLQHFDAVIVPDFGNGFISPNMVERLAEKSRFLAVNTQVNSGNRGYHLINRYPRADFISLNEPELRMAACNRTGELNQLANNIAANLQANHLAVTRGKQGVLMVSQDNGQKYSVPALSTNVVDRIGAGDAFLSLAGLCLAGRLDAEIAAFIGSVAGALDVQIVCNREPVDPVSLLKYIDTLLK